MPISVSSYLPMLGASWKVKEEVKPPRPPPKKIKKIKEQKQEQKRTRRCGNSFPKLLVVVLAARPAPTLESNALSPMRLTRNR